MKNFISKIIAWIKSNKLVTILLLVLFFMLSKDKSPTPYLGSDLMYKNAGYGGGAVSEAIPTQRSSNVEKPMYEPAPVSDATNRMVITSSNLSLQVEDVRKATEDIAKKVRELKGYVIDTYISTPEFGETGNITVRVPSATLDETLKYFRGLAVKVVSENLSGTDITDQYIDINERIARLEKTKATFEAMLDRATKVEEMLNVQREIFGLQDQIDSYKGQIKYMEESSKTSLIYINLATSELGLPYEPTDDWSPSTVFKQAYRALLANLIKIGTATIWVIVFSPLWLAAVLIYFVVKRIRANRNKPLTK